MSICSSEGDVCRCCHTEGKFRSLWESPRGTDAFFEVMKKVFDIEIKPVGEPVERNLYTICSSCVSRLEEAENFKQQVIACERIFHQMYDEFCAERNKATAQIKEEPDEVEDVPENVPVSRYSKYSMKGKSRYVHKKKLRAKRLAALKIAMEVNRLKVLRRRQAREQGTEVAVVAESTLPLTNIIEPKMEPDPIFDASIVKVETEAVGNEENDPDFDRPAVENDIENVVNDGNENRLTFDNIKVENDNNMMEKSLADNEFDDENSIHEGRNETNLIIESENDTNGNNIPNNVPEVKNVNDSETVESDTKRESNTALETRKVATSGNRSLLIDFEIESDSDGIPDTDTFIEIQGGTDITNVEKDTREKKNNKKKQATKPQRKVAEKDIQEIGDKPTEDSCQKKNNKEKESPEPQRKVAEKKIQEIGPHSDYYYLQKEDYKLEKNGYKCTRCEISVRDRRRMQKHVRTVHSMYCICWMCKETFNSLSRLAKHKFEKHNVDYRYKCQACDKAFFCKRTHKMHVERFHMMGVKEQCPYCDYSVYGISLKTHLVKHKTEKEYKCKYCEKMFLRRSTLQYHERIHTGDKRKVCKECGQAFVQKASLNYHMAKHHPGVPF